MCIEDVPLLQCGPYHPTSQSHRYDPGSSRHWPRPLHGLVSTVHSFSSENNKYRTFGNKTKVIVWIVLVIIVDLRTSKA